MCVESLFVPRRELMRANWEHHQNQLHMMLMADEQLMFPESMLPSEVAMIYGDHGLAANEGDAYAE